MPLILRCFRAPQLAFWMGHSLVARAFLSSPPPCSADAPRVARWLIAHFVHRKVMLCPTTRFAYVVGQSQHPTLKVHSTRKQRLRLRPQLRILRCRKHIASNQNTQPIQMLSHGSVWIKNSYRMSRAFSLLETPTRLCKRRWISS